MLEAPHIEPGLTVWAEIYLNRELVWERRMARAKLVERPFLSLDRRRVTPPADC
jgi:aminomethyltransferase